MKITFKGNEISLAGPLKKGDKAPVLSLKGRDLGPVEIGANTQIIMSVPSLDTPVCSSQAREFNQKLASFGIPVIVVSMDLPFAQGRFCEAQSINNLTLASDFKSREFGEKYGVLMTSGPLAGLLARAVFVLKDGVIVYEEIASEVTEFLNEAKLEDFLSGKGCGCGCAGL